MLFTFFLVFFTFVALLEGIKIDRLSYQGLIIEKLYLKWENSLLINASKIDLTALKHEKYPLTLEPLGKLPQVIRYTKEWVKEIKVDTVVYDHLNFSLHYRENLPGVITLYDKNVSYTAFFNIDEKLFKLNASQWSIKGALVDAKLSIELIEQQLYADISMQFPKIPTLHLKARGDTTQLRFTANFDNNLTTIKPIIDFFEVDAKIQPWIIQYAKASSFTLHHLSGMFHYDKPEEIITSLRADAYVKNGEYTFAEGFEPIYSPHIKLKFINGKLYILPLKGHFYNLPTEKSRLSIDFTTPQSMLEIHLLSKRAVLNESILELLHFYEIDLPIQQTSGICDIDLNLSVNLHTHETKANGTFRPSSMEILLSSIPLYSDGGIVKLHNTQVTFEQFTAHYGDDIAHARVSGEYDATSRKGAVNIEAFDISPLSNKTHLHLYSPLQPLQLTYLISPKGDSLVVMPSLWNLMGEKLTIDAFRAPFDYQKATSSFHSVPFSISNTVQGKISALLDGTKKHTDMQIELDSFKLGDIQLSHSPFKINIYHDSNLTTLRSYQSSAWSINQLPLLLSPFNAVMHKETITFDSIETVLDDLFKGNFSGKFSLRTMLGSVDISNIIPISPKVSPLVDTQENIKLKVDASGQELILDANTLKTHFTTIPNGWKITLDDISLLTKRSPLLRQYHINDGNLNIYYTPKNSRYSFEGLIRYPYHLMMINSLPISHYRFNGTYQDGHTQIRVNNRININKYEDHILIKAKNMGINVPQLFAFLSSQKQIPSLIPNKENSYLPIRIYADNTYLFLMKDRKILADSMQATLNNDDLDASLQHRSGNAVLKIRNNDFYINGKGFNDTFMEDLFALSDFSGGNFSFQAKGKSDEFEGIMRVENTILKDYKLLNNVLAFINTVPSLATFSLPNYNTQGLPVEEGYAQFNYKNGIVNVHNFTLNSPEIKILGEGNSNLKTKTLNGSLTLKTDLGSALAKVPMVGYILFGDDGSISTTVSISGNIENPKIETAIAKEIVTAPYNMVKRTLVYPFLWMIDDKKKK